MADHKLDFMNAPEENLKTWDKIWKLMIISGAAVLVVLLLLGWAFA
ncbi:MAG: hypothetical protein OEY16_00430 [Alphaproteobacteria bacterium]|nr:hypothetical protein [Alphaproteobacteria bacterium]